MGRTPEASSPDALARMRRQRRRDTAPELALRSLLHRRGRRFRVDFPLPTLRRRADIVFPRERVAVFVDGCFWHGCPAHATQPKQNREWWEAKIVQNRLRDTDTDRRLEALGWTSVRVWEHENPGAAADRIDVILRRARSRETGAR